MPAAIGLSAVASQLIASSSGGLGVRNGPLGALAAGLVFYWAMYVVIDSDAAVWLGIQAFAAAACFAALIATAQLAMPGLPWTRVFPVASIVGAGYTRVTAPLGDYELLPSSSRWVRSHACGLRFDPADRARSVGPWAGCGVELWY